MQKKKPNDHKFDVYYDPNRHISFQNDCHLGSQSFLTWPVMKKRQHERNKIQELYKISVIKTFLYIASPSPICTRNCS